MPQLEYIIKGLKKAAAGKRTRFPTTPPILHQLKQAWERYPNRRDASMLRVAGCLCFFGVLRTGEAMCPSVTIFDPTVHLCFSDARVNSLSAPRMLEVHIKASKTDPFRQGVSIFLGTTGNDLCPVAAMMAYMTICGNRSGPMFLFSDGRFLTREGLVSHLTKA